MAIPEPEDLLFLRNGDLLVLTSPARSSEDGTPRTRPRGAQPMVRKYRLKPIDIVTLHKNKSNENDDGPVEPTESPLVDLNTLSWEWFGLGPDCNKPGTDARAASDPAYGEPAWSYVAEANGLCVDN